MGGAERPQESGQPRQPDSLLPWQWPTPNSGGQPSSNTSDESSGARNPSEWLNAPTGSDARQRSHASSNARPSMIS